MKLSIVVPAYNEAGNIEALIYRIAQNARGQNYEVIVVDDYSNDGTWEMLQELQERYPLKIFRKHGPKGKAYSLYQGLDEASGDILAMIDADLQYPPEEIFPMIQQLEIADVVIANRRTYYDSQRRKIQSEVFRTLFGKFLFGISEDIQSGLKVFKREVYDTVRFKPASKWSFDLEFLHRAKKAGFKLAGHNIIFLKRNFGKSKVNNIGTTLELATNAISLRFKTIGPQPIIPRGAFMTNAGVGYKGKKYVTHSTLSHKESALKNLYLWQKVVIVVGTIFFYRR